MDLTDDSFTGRTSISELTDSAPTLAKEEWIINGITLRKPTKVLVRERYSGKTSSQD